MPVPIAGSQQVQGSQTNTVLNAQGFMEMGAKIWGLVNQMRQNQIDAATESLNAWHKMFGGDYRSALANPEIAGPLTRTMALAGMSEPEIAGFLEAAKSRPLTLEETNRYIQRRKILGGPAAQPTQQTMKLGTGTAPSQGNLRPSPSAGPQQTMKPGGTPPQQIDTAATQKAGLRTGTDQEARMMAAYKGALADRSWYTEELEKIGSIEELALYKGLADIGLATEEAPGSWVAKSPAEMSWTNYMKSTPEISEATRKWQDSQKGASPARISVEVEETPRRTERAEEFHVDEVAASPMPEGNPEKAIAIQFQGASPQKKKVVETLMKRVLKSIPVIKFERPATVGRVTGDLKKIYQLSGKDGHETMTRIMTAPDDAIDNAILRSAGLENYEALELSREDALFQAGSRLADVTMPGTRSLLTHKEELIRLGIMSKDTETRRQLAEASIKIERIKGRLMEAQLGALQGAGAEGKVGYTPSDLVSLYEAAGDYLTGRFRDVGRKEAAKMRQEDADIKSALALQSWVMSVISGVPAKLITDFRGGGPIFGMGAQQFGTPGFDPYSLYKAFGAETGGTTGRAPEEESKGTALGGEYAR